MCVLAMHFERGRRAEAYSRYRNVTEGKARAVVRRGACIVTPSLIDDYQHEEEEMKEGRRY